VTVEDAVVTPDDVEEYLGTLRERFASLKGVQRPAASGDYVSIDLSATADGKPVEDAQASGLSYEIGSGSLLDGLDDALTGLSAGESATFGTDLAGGEHEGERADVTVTVHSVKERDMPGLDDEFAQLASEFDTIGELRADSRARLEQMKRSQQALQARDHAVDALLGRIDIPLPERVVADEADNIRRSMHEQVERAGADWGSYLQMVGKSEEEFETELADQARRSVKTSLVLDKLARQEEIGVDETDLSYFVAQQAQRMGVPPDRLARQLADSGQIGSVAADVLRSKAMALLAERVKIRDESGNEVDYAALTRREEEAEEAESSQAGEDGEDAGGDTGDGTAADTGAEAASGSAPAGESAGAAE
jgi:trigger factor